MVGDRCKYCGSMNLIENEDNDEPICEDCGFGQYSEYPVSVVRGHRWHVGPADHERKMVTISRIGWEYVMKKTGVVARTIEVPFSEISDRVRKQLNLY